LRYKLSRREQAIIKTPDLIRDYMNVQDAGYIIAKAALEKEAGFYNVCTGEGISLRQFAENIAQEYGANEFLLMERDEMKKNHPLIIGTDPLIF
jgi:dTDP-6-deoxy-L-talose 4-dehydrogenase (NAD+)